MTNGYNGVPAGFISGYQAMAGITTYPLGDFDGDGVPDVLLGSIRLTGTNNVNGGGAIVMLLNADGTAKRVVKLADGMSGIPAGTFGANGFVRALGVLGDVDGDGVTDIMMGGSPATSGSSRSVVYFLTLMNPDGTVKAITKLADGQGGMPAGEMPSVAYFSTFGSAVADINGDGVGDLISGVPTEATGGAVWVVMPGLTPLSNNAQSVGFGGAGVVERRLYTSNEVVAWEKFVAEADIPAGTTLAYSIGRVVGDDFVYDLGPTFTDIPAPLPLDGLDISGIAPNYQDLVVKMTYKGVSPKNLVIPERPVRAGLIRGLAACSRTISRGA